MSAVRPLASRPRLAVLAVGLAALLAPSVAASPVAIRGPVSRDAAVVPAAAAGAEAAGTAGTALLVGTVSLTNAPAANLRVNLDRLLAEHAFLTIEQMRSGLASSPDFAAAAKAVEGNSTDVTSAIATVYGAAAGARFGDIWRSHIGYLVDYSIALGKGDQAAAQTALDNLASYRVAIRQLLTEANPGVDLSAITAALDTHTAQLVAFIAAEHSGDEGRAYAIERDAYPHMFMIGDDLAKVIANESPDRFAGLDVAYSGAGTLRVTLDRLLGEHMFLTGEVLRAALTGTAYLDASKAALDQNSAALGSLIEAGFGHDAAAAFAPIWQAHISAYLAYLDAAKANDANAKATALQQIDDAAAQIAGFFAAALPGLDASAVTQALQAHAGHLIREVDAYAAGDYDGAYSLGREGYGHMFQIGETLAAAIAAQLPAKFPAMAAPPNTATEAGPTAPAARHWQCHVP
jgi:hypothetical protein